MNGEPISGSDLQSIRHLLEDLRDARMPFGKYGPTACPPNGARIASLPLEYLQWFKEKGFPKGKLGTLMAMVWQVKSEGLGDLLHGKIPEDLSPPP